MAVQIEQMARSRNLYVRLVERFKIARLTRHVHSVAEIV